MRTYEEIRDSALDSPPFSNASQADGWMYNWCERCRNDSQELVDRGEGCPLILCAMLGKTPIEWLTQTAEDQILARFHCIEFRDEDDGDDGDGREPQPLPEDPNQCVLWPREQYEGVRMLVQSAELVPA